jgi:hypothetical protein
MAATSAKAYEAQLRSDALMTELVRDWAATQFRAHAKLSPAGTEARRMLKEASAEVQAIENVVVQQKRQRL